MPRGRSSRPNATSPKMSASAALRLEDTLKRETFFRELPAIDQLARAVEDAYNQRLGAAVASRADAYAQAVDTLQSTPGWEALDDEQRRRIAGPLETPRPSRSSAGRSPSPSYAPTSTPARRGSAGPFRTCCRFRKASAWSRSPPALISPGASRAKNSSRRRSAHCATTACITWGRVRRC